ncbi:MAG TPA: phenylalanine--tRNA ligase subunit beta [Candidatus Acidoferrales bacterium]|nr:phenylalanine--tRNA ligase subunit beta [Candidatus Acidoferrales bacterium]
MRIDPQWLREFVNITVQERQLADDLTLAGIAVESVKEIDGRLLFEMEIGTNRPDAMCHYGVARECSAIYNIDLKPIKPTLPNPKPAAKSFPIEIEDPEGCKRYTARVVRHVKIGPSPASILERLKIDDHGGVSNAVDASNYTLMEMGHPTHAFDLDKLEGGKIVVRRARPGEVLTTLDGIERKLDAEDLVIADVVRPVALAGVMGGLDSAISAATKNILIESAWFDPVSVRKTARRHGMHTDASHIFERGADWGATLLACNRVAELVLETAGGELEGEPVDAIAGHVLRHGVWLRRGEVLRHLGQDISEKSIEQILHRLGFQTEPITGEVPEELRSAANLPREKKAATIESISQATGLAPAKITELMAASRGWGPGWKVTLPTWRLDVEREIDLIEEIARIHGYNRFENRLPSFSGGVVELPNAAKEARVRSELLALGYNEAVSSTFISPAEAQAFSSATPVILANPLSEEQSAMRTSLLPGMLAMAAWNLNRGMNDVRLFEAGHIFELNGDKSEERRIFSIGATGNAMAPNVHTSGRAYSFFDLKGDVETLLGGFELPNASFDAHTSSYFHPGRSARALADGNTIAQFGQLHPDVAAARKLKQEIYIAEIYVDRLFALPLRTPRYQPFSKFPAVDRDFSFLFPESITFAQIESAARGLNIADMQNFRPVEIFRGGSVPAGKYSVLLRAEFHSIERTLRDDEVAHWSTQIIKALEQLGGAQRA